MCGGEVRMGPLASPQAIILSIGSASPKMITLDWLLLYSIQLPRHGGVHMEISHLLPQFSPYIWNHHPSF